MGQLEFVHLHNHGEYSLNDAMSKHKQMIKAVKERGMKKVALTDHGVMFGIIDFYKECKAQEVDPIIGCEVYVAPRLNTLKEGKMGDDANYHLVLLCENNDGMRSLREIASDAAVNGFYYRARTDKEKLKQWNNGLIALSACLGGEVQWKLLNESYESGKQIALEYDAIFGRGNFYLELQNHGIEEQLKVNEMLLKLSRETGIPLVATNDTHYVNKEDAAPHDVLMAIQSGTTIEDTKRKVYATDQFYIKTPEEMWAMFGDVCPEALRNTVHIAERCNVTIEFGNYKIPRFPLPPGETSSEALFKRLVYEGAKRRYTGANMDRVVKYLKLKNEDEAWKAIWERIDYEIDIITKMGYCDYFLIIWDFLKYYQGDLGGPLSPGRGSAAGSVVSYSLSITHVEPLQNGLLFERFLNPNRVTMPDVDLDFCILLRELVIQYVIKKYGEDHIAQIITFGTYAARAAIRAVGRGLDYEYALADKVAKMIPQIVGITIEKSMEMNQELKTLYDNDPRVKKLIDYAIAIEGLPSNTSTHAAGVLICPTRVVDHVPVWVNDGVIVSQHNMIELEELGLLKMDFLGLRNLTVINDTLRGIKRNHGVSITHEELLEAIYNPKSLVYIGKGFTQGIFQMEGAGMTSFMKQLQPINFAEVTAGISLYRPGPMDFIPNYLANRQHPNNIAYLDPKLEKHLRETYGVITYQEQCMFIAVDLAGYGQKDSDDFRKGISKKKKKEIEKHKGWFIHGCNDGNVSIPGAVNLGIDERIATEIFDQMEDFSSYAFNKSHAACYAVIAMETSYLKHEYPVEFMASLLTSVAGVLSKAAQYINHCEKDLGIEVLPPDVNESTDVFVATREGKIRFGLTAVKGVGEKVVQAIVKERDINGRFKSFRDFMQRMKGEGGDRGVIESLIRAGAFDFTGKTRTQLMAVLDDVKDDVDAYRKKIKDGQMVLFTPPKPIVDIVPPIKEYPERIFLSIEKETLGLYVSGHPLNSIRAYAEENSNIKTSDLVVDEDDESTEIIEKIPYYDGQRVSLVCIVTGIHEITTRKGDLMAFVTVEDLYGSVELVVFPSTYSLRRELLKEDTMILVSGRISVKDEAVTIIANEIFPAAPYRPKQVYIGVNSLAEVGAVLECIEGNTGDMAVNLIWGDWKVTLSKQLWTNDQGIRMLNRNQIKFIIEGDE